VWTAATAGAPSAWTEHLGADDVAEIIAAVAVARRRGRNLHTMTVADFPLPRLAERVRRWSAELHAGRGFVFVRGFPVATLPPDDVELAYLGLGLHLGDPVSQDALGTRLGHVRDRGQPRTSPAVRLYATTERQDFHTDGADIVGLLCLHGARSGGESRLASAGAIYNELLRRDPSLLTVLYEPLPWDRNDEQRDGESPFFELPAIHDVNGAPRVFYIGWYIRDSQRHGDAPRLRPEQRAAMDAIESIANDPAFHVEMDFQPGDIQWLNNATMLHAREAYVDWDEPARKRHLLRLWLSAHDFAGVEDLLRQGIPARDAAE
jgi:hypothetical protein